jgi:hypothetical protein
MKYSRANVGRISLNDYVSIVHEIYSPHDINRSIWDVWCHALHHAGALAEKVRSGKTADDLVKDEDIADLALWLFTVLYKITGKIGEQKGARETPEEPLIKISASISDLLALSYGFDGSTNKPMSIDDWQKVVGEKLASLLKALSLRDLSYRMLEELAATSDAMIRMYCYVEEKLVVGEPIRRRSRLESRLGELFIWLFALVEKIGLEISRKGAEHARILLSEIIWARYGSDEGHCFCCRHCKNQMCSCRIILVPATYPIEELLRLAEER